MTSLLDKKKLRSGFERAAATYDGSAVLQREIAERMLERLDLVKLNPQTVLDIGSGTGYCTRALAQRYPKAQVIGLDISHAMNRHASAQRGWFARHQYIGGDAETLPFADNSIDLLFSSLALQWCDTAQAFQEFFRVLRPGGLLMFSSFGPDTLHELRAAWQQVDNTPHVHQFIDMHDLGDLLLHTRFADPVMDMENLSVTYGAVMDLLRDLKNIGANNAAPERRHGLTGKHGFARFCKAYQDFARDGRIPASYEVVYGHAWVPEAKPPVPVGARASAVIPIRPVDN